MGGVVHPAPYSTGDLDVMSKELRAFVQILLGEEYRISQSSTSRGGDAKM
jgi:hypothetical protein